MLPGRLLPPPGVREVIWRPAERRRARCPRSRIVRVDEDRQRRVAENEAMSRDVNEAIEKALWEAEEGSSTGFLCECARPDCHHVVQATLREYERVRAHPRRFMVHPGHEEPGAERIVDTQSDYLVVEKSDKAGRVAETMDPRG